MLLNNYVQTQSIPNFAFLIFISIVEYRVDRNHCWTWTRALKTTITLCISTLPTMLSAPVICFRTKCFPRPWKKSTLLYKKLFPGPILHVDYSITWILLLIIWHDPGFFFWNSSLSSGLLHVNKSRLHLLSIDDIENIFKPLLFSYKSSILNQGKKQVLYFPLINRKTPTKIWFLSSSKPGQNHW